MLLHRDYFICLLANPVPIINMLILLATKGAARIILIFRYFYYDIT